MTRQEYENKVQQILDKFPKEEQEGLEIFFRSYEEYVELTELLDNDDYDDDYDEDLYLKAVKMIRKVDKCSISIIKKLLGTTFGTAGKIMDRFEQEGIIERVNGCDSCDNKPYIKVVK